jgi:alkylation response protein AidB-like acyl-CoA dehydrogenase
MKQPGVEVRPIKQIDGSAEFNEVFFTEARCPRRNVVGGDNNGWKVAMTTLGFERGHRRPPPATAASRRSSTPSSTRPGAGAGHRSPIRQGLARPGPR